MKITKRSRTNPMAVIALTLLSCGIAIMATSGFAQVSGPEGTAGHQMARRAVDLVTRGEFMEAQKLLSELNDGDFRLPPRKEIMSFRDDGTALYEIVHVPPIGNRLLLLARCQVNLGNHADARVVLWQLTDQECMARDFFLLMVEEFANVDYTNAVDRLATIQKKFPNNDAAELSRKYLEVAHGFSNSNVEIAVSAIRSGAWDRQSESGPLAEFKEWVCNMLAKDPSASVPLLMEELRTGDEPTWVIHSLALCNDPKAIVPLEDCRLRIKNYYARKEIDVALEKLKKTIVEPSAAPLPSDPQPGHPDGER